MGEIKWYKRDPNAALVGMASLSFEERGAYNTILDLLYARDGNLPDNEGEIARLANCDKRTWRRLRRRLMDLGKLYIHGGNLRNERANDREIPYALERIGKTKLAGLKGAETRKQQKRTSGELQGRSSGDVRTNLISLYNKNKGLGPARG